MKSDKLDLFQIRLRLTVQDTIGRRATTETENVDNGKCQVSKKKIKPKAGKEKISSSLHWV